MVTHPWGEGDPPTFNRLISAFPEPAPYYFVHDIALLPHVRGKGAGFGFFRAFCLEKLAAFQAIRLVAITLQMRAACQKMGFRVLHAPCSTYGSDSAFMELRRDGQIA